MSADYVLYVTSAPCEPGTMAYAGVCAVGGPDSRPIMGSINLCPGSFEALPPKRQMETVIHELLHAFVRHAAACTDTQSSQQSSCVSSGLTRTAAACRRPLPAGVLAVAVPAVCVGRPAAQHNRAVWQRHRHRVAGGAGGGAAAERLRQRGRRGVGRRGREGQQRQPLVRMAGDCGGCAMCTKLDAAVACLPACREARLFQGELMLAAAPFAGDNAPRAGSRTAVGANRVCFTLLLRLAGRADKLPRMDLTAALLADSGWYIPRAGVMPPLDFGAGAGCAWLGSKARAWMATVPAQQLYCSAASQASKNGAVHDGGCAAEGSGCTQVTPTCTRAFGLCAGSATCTYDHQGVAECFKALGGGGGTGATGAVGAAGSASLAFLNGVAFPFALGGGANCLSSAMPTPGEVMACMQVSCARVCHDRISLRLRRHQRPASVDCHLAARRGVAVARFVAGADVAVLPSAEAAGRRGRP